MLNSSNETGRIPAMNVALKRRASASDLHVVGCVFISCFSFVWRICAFWFLFRVGVMVFILDFVSSCFWLSIEQFGFHFLPKEKSGRNCKKSAKTEKKA